MSDMTPSNGPTSDDALPKPSIKSERHPEPAVVRWLRVNPQYRRVALVFVAVSLISSSAIIAYVCWIRFLPPVWRWGFEPTTWRGILAFFGAFYLIVAPVVPFVFGGDWLSGIVNLFAEEREKQLKNSLSQLETSKVLTEESLATNDATGLIPRVRYSRLQLESYYTIGLGQTQRSFRYSILAMWIGFLIIAGGIVLYAVPIRPEIHRPNIHLLAIASGIVIELISALFLWIYRSSIGQLTYFYNRQMYLHSVLVAMKIADTMTDSDQAKHSIIDRILDSESQSRLKQPPLYRFRGTPKPEPAANGRAEPSSVS
jgi:hypothetical protein